MDRAKIAAGNRLIVPFKAHHFDWLMEAGPKADGGLQLPMSTGLMRHLEGQNSWTGVVDGEPIVCAGTIEHWPGRHQAWAYLGLNSGPHMTWITLAVRKNLKTIRGRIECTVRADFELGQRWAEMLGFEIEAPRMRQYGPEGEDHIGFVRIT